MKQWQRIVSWLWLHNLWFPVDSRGVNFYHRKAHDEVYWLWPWNRYDGNPYFAVLAGRSFPNISSIETYWRYRNHYLGD